MKRSVVRLKPFEIDQCLAVARTRSGYSAVPTCFAEKAVSVLLDLPWTGIESVEADVGGAIDVSVSDNPTASLVIWAGDVHRPTVLAICSTPACMWHRRAIVAVEIAGWLDPHDAIGVEGYYVPDDQWWVPQSHLEPIRSLWLHPAFPKKKAPA